MFQKPKISEDYTGDLYITKKELPSTKPILTGPESGFKDNEHIFTINTSNPESDRIRYYIDWGDGNAKWTELYNSNESVTLTHTWSSKGTYNIFFKCMECACPTRDFLQPLSRYKLRT